MYVNDSIGEADVVSLLDKEANDGMPLFINPIGRTSEVVALKFQNGIENTFVALFIYYNM